MFVKLFRNFINTPSQNTSLDRIGAIETTRRQFFGVLIGGGLSLSGCGGGGGGGGGGTASTLNATNTLRNFIVEEYGDSTTFGAEGNKVIMALRNGIPLTTKAKIYADPRAPEGVDALLKSLGCQNTSYRNLGMNGMRTDTLLSGQNTSGEVDKDGIPMKFDNWETRMSKSNADYISLNLGINDADQLLSPEKFIENMEKIIDIAFKYKKKVVLQTPNPVVLTGSLEEFNNPDGTKYTLDQANQRRIEMLVKYIEPLRNLAKRKNIPLVDNYAAFMNNALLVPDGTHPSQDGYNIKIREIAKILNSIGKTEGACP